MNYVQVFQWTARKAVVVYVKDRGFSSCSDDYQQKRMIWLILSCYQLTKQNGPVYWLCSARFYS